MYPNDDTSRTDTGGELSRGDTENVLHHGCADFITNERSKGMKGSKQVIGAVLTTFGGAGLAEISTSNHGCFWLCAVMFAVGFAMCLMGYRHEQ